MALNKDLLFDTRVLERNLRKGLLDHETLEKHLSSLANAADNADFVDYTAEPEEEAEAQADAETKEEAGREA
ncbi:MAG: hypothetical protein GX614_11540 [Sandaracinaceae bacterium]|nr:hypothetical protein [Sandaracinaceae bacterium]